MSSLPVSVRCYLCRQLDWDHEGVEKDLHKIADSMLNWEEDLSAALCLTAVDINDIKAVHLNNPALQRYAFITCMQDT